MRLKKDYDPQNGFQRIYTHKFRTGIDLDDTSFAEMTEGRVNVKHLLADCVIKDFIVAVLMEMNHITIEEAMRKSHQLYKPEDLDKILEI